MSFRFLVSTEVELQSLINHRLQDRLAVKGLRLVVISDGQGDLGCPGSTLTHPAAGASRKCQRRRVGRCRVARSRSNADWPSTPGASVGAGPTVLVAAYHHRFPWGRVSQVAA